ncbi:hypothetical protein GCM10027022_10930 [Alpinimonas psychrophila]|uniref:Seryl-tRNA(Sec) selenium transferase n=1 Tax=Alpinimonas psychrophila TaxID=748908 RepID=A0A7W3PP74_9MICO|nr:hypothetical protein [Alpinimonas psychrophila]MBA8828918.1 seryl-tRNA(Sec) selenium transferase [Alpinimonas psychrophila]
MNVYEPLGAARVLNGVRPATRRDGMSLHPDGSSAVPEALTSWVSMDVLERAAGKRLSELLRVTSIYFTTGAFAALFLATAATMARGRADLKEQLPNTKGMKHKVIIQSPHRDPYDRTAVASDATLVPIGYPDSIYAGELECVLDERFRRPQASGLLSGTPEFLDVIVLQHQDVDESEVTWPRHYGLTNPTTPPCHGIGRPMKVGREQIVGLLTTIERYVDHPCVDEQTGLIELDLVEQIVRDNGAIGVERLLDPALHVEFLRLAVSNTGSTADIFALDRPAYRGESEAWRNVLTVDNMALAAAGEGGCSARPS